MTSRPEFISLDYGIKRVGVARSVLGTRLVLPVCTINLSNNKKTHGTEVLRYLEDNELMPTNKLIVGYPIGMNNQPTEQTKIVDSFIDQIKSKCDGLVIDTVDERLSSSEARLILTNSRKKTKRMDGAIDMSSAVIILNSYLEAMRD
jgi:putative holliday junction resolvase